MSQQDTPAVEPRTGSGLDAYSTPELVAELLQRIKHSNGLEDLVGGAIYFLPPRPTRRPDQPR